MYPRSLSENKGQQRSVTQGPCLWLPPCSSGLQPVSGPSISAPPLGRALGGQTYTFHIALSSRSPGPDVGCSAGKEVLAGSRACGFHRTPGSMCAATAPLTCRNPQPLISSPPPSRPSCALSLDVGHLNPPLRNLLVTPDTSYKIILNKTVIFKTVVFKRKKPPDCMKDEVRFP